jgi:hypothetical protein
MKSEYVGAMVATIALTNMHASTASLISIIHPQTVPFTHTATQRLKKDYFKIGIMSEAPVSKSDLLKDEGNAFFKGNHPHHFFSSSTSSTLPPLLSLPHLLINKLNYITDGHYVEAERKYSEALTIEKTAVLLGTCVSNSLLSSPTPLYRSIMELMMYSIESSLPT